MNKNPLISIIIPCYNRVNLLKDTLKSVELAIDNLNAEIILVDDGSETIIENQLENFSHLPIKHLRQVNSGLTISRYNGLMQATGEYIQFLDSDDEISHDKLTKQIHQMVKSGADVSHSDVLHKNLNPDRLPTTHVTKYNHSTNPAEFYIDIQPAPHSPIFKRQYLTSALKRTFIPLSREYDSIGEVWLYYNLSPFPAKIIKIDEPLTICIHHDQERLTNHWERLGLCALTLQFNFIKYCPKSEFSNDARKFVGKAAFITYRKLPYDMHYPFQNAFLSVWEKLGATRELGSGKYFNMLSKSLGLKNSAKLFKRLFNVKYETIRTIENEELIQKTSYILKDL